MQPLSPRDLTIMHHLDRGLTPQQIALALGISEAAVYVHLRRIGGSQSSAHFSSPERRDGRERRRFG
jgi:DNA-binding CsgD family transcriptional regulator